MANHRARKRWDKHVWAAIHAKPILSWRPQALRRANVTVTRYAKRQIKDRENLMVIAKPICDSLVSNGLITDDSMDHIDLRVEQGKLLKGEPPHTHILIEAMP
jgi:hypothetical protein